MTIMLHDHIAKIYRANDSEDQSEDQYEKLRTQLGVIIKRVASYVHYGLTLEDAEYNLTADLEKGMLTDEEHAQEWDILKLHFKAYGDLNFKQLYDMHIAVADFAQGSHLSVLWRPEPLTLIEIKPNSIIYEAVLSLLNKKDLTLC